MEAAARRRKLAARITGVSTDDKRDRPPTSISTKVTPEGKKPCTGDRDVIEPRALSFSEADTRGENTLNLCIYIIYIYMYR